MELMLSGIKPTGKLTLGNYIGAIQNFIELQDKYKTMIFIANLHAITIPIERQELIDNTRDIAALYLACGLDPKKVIFFKQSDVSEHASLGYILTCNSYMGELSRMTQFKDKTRKSKKSAIPTGLFIYPPLQAADILLYDAMYVPIGEDQKQHVELSRDIAIRFNNRYGPTFVVPKPIMPEKGARIKSLSDPTKKMSKSEGLNDKGCIYLLDDLDVARKKIMSAVTDSENIIRYDEENKPGISNLMTIYSCLKSINYKEIEKEFANKGYGDFKKSVADVVVSKLKEIQDNYHEIIKQGKLETIFEQGAIEAKKVASKKLKEVEEKIGITY